MNPTKVLRTLTDLIEEYGGTYLGNSANGHLRYTLGSQTLTLPREHTFVGSRRAFRNVRAQIKRAIRDQGLKPVERVRPVEVLTEVDTMTVTDNPRPDPRPFAPHTETLPIPVDPPAVTRPLPASLQKAIRASHTINKSCPICGKTCKASGLSAHVKMIHEGVHPRWGKLKSHHATTNAKKSSFVETLTQIAKTLTQSATRLTDLVVRAHELEKENKELRMREETLRKLLLKAGAK